MVAPEEAGIALTGGKSSAADEAGGRTAGVHQPGGILHALMIKQRPVDLLMSRAAGLKTLIEIFSRFDVAEPEKRFAYLLHDGVLVHTQFRLIDQGRQPLE